MHQWFSMQFRTYKLVSMNFQHVIYEINGIWLQSHVNGILTFAKSSSTAANV